MVGVPLQCDYVWESCRSDPHHQYTCDTAVNDNNLWAHYKLKLRFNHVYLCQRDTRKLKPAMRCCLCKNYRNFERNILKIFTYICGYFLYIRNQ